MKTITDKFKSQLERSFRILLNGKTLKEQRHILHQQENYILKHYSTAEECEYCLYEEERK